ncbi:MAG: hypothetical protein HF976_07775 [ANME-2 cluster archaeon]|nr:hypothetical protein [ANME-2 cluster archaeon]MBC2701297.1 hypothetical protein [ANME-2 cluster archaeon]MBC2708593.1 hypothetical protein [ANME-2 cluster archaeon]MBC2745498.1 hypothetical protein [ANME-2 cluster archaeon]MBC2762766.1 hypothetical protein [ANME-2 cluster archaeon]
MGLAALCLAVCADFGLAFGDIWILAYLPGRSFDRILRLPGFKVCVAGPAFV